MPQKRPDQFDPAPSALQLTDTVMISRGTDIYTTTVAELLSTYLGTSVSSVAIGTGTKIFTTQAGKPYYAGLRLRIAKDSTNYVEGVVASYSGTTLTMTIDKVVGSGTHTSWSIGLAGDTGAAGATGPGYLATSVTSTAISLGSKTIATQSGLAYVAGSRVKIIYDSTHYMEGIVTSYVGSSMDIDVDAVVGTGTYASWSLTLSGSIGPVGPASTLTLANKTANHTITGAETNYCFSNKTATGLITFTLPVPAAGLAFTFYVRDNDGIKISSLSPDIRVGKNSGLVQHLQSLEIGCRLVLRALDATEWIVEEVSGGVWSSPGSASPTYIGSDSGIYSPTCTEISGCGGSITASLFAWTQTNGIIEVDGAITFTITSGTPATGTIELPKIMTLSGSDRLSGTLIGPVASLQGYLGPDATFQEAQFTVSSPTVTGTHVFRVHMKIVLPVG